MAYSEAYAYENCFAVIKHAFEREPSSKVIADAYADINQRLRQARRIELVNNLKNIGINNIHSLHCSNVVAIEKAKKDILGLYQNLKWINEFGLNHNTDYESIIPVGEGTSENA